MTCIGHVRCLVDARARLFESSTRGGGYCSRNYLHRSRSFVGSMQGSMIARWYESSTRGGGSWSSPSLGSWERKSVACNSCWRRRMLCGEENFHLVFSFL